MRTAMNTFSTLLDNDGILTITIDIKEESMNVFNQQVMQDFQKSIKILNTTTILTLLSLPVASKIALSRVRISKCYKT